MLDATAWSAAVAAPLALAAMELSGREPPWAENWIEGAALLALAGVSFGTSRWRRAANRMGQRLKTLNRDASDLIFATDSRGVIRTASDAAHNVLGYTPEEMIGRPLRDFVQGPIPFLDSHPEGDPATLTWNAAWVCADGSTVHLAAVLHSLHRNGSDGGVAGLVRDQRDRIESERALRESEERFRTALNTARNGIMLVAHDGRLLLANEALHTLLGHSVETMTTLTLADIVPAAYLDRIVALMASRLWSGVAPSQYEVQMQNAAGQPLDVEITLSPVREAGRSTGVLIEVHDLTESRRASDTIRRMADYDRLTGLPNRELFDRHVQRALIDARHEGRSVAVLMLDLDRFKLINDTLGHPSGDRLLKAVADRLRTHLPPQHVVARFGGDEFLVLVPDLGSSAAAEGVAKRILAAFQQPFEHDGHDLKLSVSTGIALSTDTLSDPDMLILVADAALYEAKAEGGNRYIIGSESARDPARSRLALENDLRRAVEQNALEIYYQPQFDVRTAQVRGVEALLRWRHPERGLISPTEFVPLLEETGLIVPVGEWVLRTACAQVQRWHASGLTDVRLAVNLSPRQLLVSNLHTITRTILEETGLDPRALELELTETAVMFNLEAVLDVLRELRATGVTIAIDDFGVGQSWLVRLKEFPVHTLKVDRYFVAGVDDSPEGLAIVEAIVALGHALGLTIVAEGVETALELEAIRSAGCDLVQGFFFAPALPAAEIEALFTPGRVLLPAS